MMTIKEMSELSGVSARTLRYYDEIGLFHPTGKSDAGYRLYDETSLETLRSILYFREMDIPLNSIKEIINNPALDKYHVLEMQKKMLESERNRLNRLIDSIDAALKGAEMDFTVFTREESTELFNAMLANMPDEMKNEAAKEFGSVDKWREHYLEAVGSEKVQRQYAKIVEWYGGKDEYADSVKNPLSAEISESYKKRIDRILEDLSRKQNLDVNCFEIRQLIGEYGFVLKQLLQLKEEKGMMLSQARAYLDKQVQTATDEKYGEGFAAFLNEAITGFYER